MILTTYFMIMIKVMCLVFANSNLSNVAYLPHICHTDST